MDCHAASMRDWRKTNPLKGAAREKAICRSYTRVYIRRGKLIPKPCEVCRGSPVQPHHDDYKKPLSVRWFCRPCHLRHHGKSPGKFIPKFLADRMKSNRGSKWGKRSGSWPSSRERFLVA